MQLWLGFILWVLFIAVEKQNLYFVGFLQVLVQFLYQVVYYRHKYIWQTLVKLEKHVIQLIF